MHVWSGRGRKTSHFLYVFLKREMLVQLVNLEKCHSPLRLCLSLTGTVFPLLRQPVSFLCQLLPNQREITSRGLGWKQTWKQDTVGT
jgi:hypothetical protein